MKEGGREDVGGWKFEAVSSPILSQRATICIRFSVVSESTAVIRRFFLSRCLVDILKEFEIRQRFRIKASVLCCRGI